jgi:hypothetical protein
VLACVSILRHAHKVANPRVHSNQECFAMEPLPEAGTPQAREALAEEAVLNAAMAFAGHVVADAETRAAQLSGSLPPALATAVHRQFLLETATLCLRRLGEAFTTGLEDAVDDGVRDLMRDGASQAVAATAATEALGDLSLDLLDRLVDPRI